MVVGKSEARWWESAPGSFDQSQEGKLARITGGAGGGSPLEYLSGPEHFSLYFSHQRSRSVCHVACFDVPFEQDLRRPGSISKAMMHEPGSPRNALQRCHNEHSSKLE